MHMGMCSCACVPRQAACESPSLCSGLARPAARLRVCNHPPTTRQPPANRWSTVRHPLAGDLVCIWRELKAVQLRSLNRERAEMVIERWLLRGAPPSSAEVGGPGPRNRALRSGFRRRETAVVVAQCC
jgi:hypothetical protein